jgi:hypothetical protein
VDFIVDFDSIMKGDSDYERAKKKYNDLNKKYGFFSDGLCVVRIGNCKMCRNCELFPKLTKEVDTNSNNSLYISVKLSCDCHSTEILGNNFDLCLDSAVESWNSDMVDLEYHKYLGG